MAANIFTFLLPDIGEGVVEGEVIEWLKKEGDSVSQDEPVVTVMTDKATVELPAPYPGKVVKHYYHVGEVAIKDQPLYSIELAEGVVPLEEKKPSKTKPLKATLSDDIKPAKVVSEAHPGIALATPKVRRMAQELGVDLERINGSGKGGRVTEEDLHRATNTSSSGLTHVILEGDDEYPLAGVRGLMAKRMDQTNIPQFSYFEQVDATRLMEMKDKFKTKATSEGISLSYMPFLIRALSIVIKKHPILNASIDMPSSKVVIHKRQNIGVAMATATGLIVPVLKDVDTMSLQEIIRAYDQLKMQAQEGKLTSADMKEATITISNFGVLGGEGLWATPMIIDPEVAILAVARIRETPVVKNHEVVVRSVLPLSWSFDHRLIDGELAATISTHYCSLIRESATLL